MLKKVKALAKQLQNLSAKKESETLTPPPEPEINSDNDGDFAALPMEIVFRILSFCSLDAMMTFSAVNRHFHASLKDNEYIWKDFYQNNCKNFSDFSVITVVSYLLSRKN